MQSFNFDVLKAGDIDDTLGKTVKEVILTSNTFAVYMDTDDIIQWSSSKGHDNFGSDFGKIQSQITYWESIANNLFDKKEAYDIKTALAESYAVMLDQGNDASAQENIDRVSPKRITIKGKEILRIQYILYSLLTTIGVIALVLLCILFKEKLVTIITYEEYRILLTSFFGGLGAFVFTMFRSKKYEAEIILGKDIHRLDGFLRIVYGLFAGLIVSIAIRSNIALGFIKDAGSNNSIEIFMGVIAGASEILLPNIIKKVENTA